MYSPRWRTKSVRKKSFDCWCNRCDCVASDTEDGFILNVTCINNRQMDFRCFGEHLSWIERKKTNEMKNECITLVVCCKRRRWQVICFTFTSNYHWIECEHCRCATHTKKKREFPSQQCRTSTRKMHSRDIFSSASLLMNYSSHFTRHDARKSRQTTDSNRFHNSEMITFWRCPCACQIPVISVCNFCLRAKFQMTFFPYISISFASTLVNERVAKKNINNSHCNQRFLFVIDLLLFKFNVN